MSQNEAYFEGFAGTSGKQTLPEFQVIRNGAKILLDSPDELKEGDLVEVPFGEPKTIATYEDWFKDFESKLALFEAELREINKLIDNLNPILGTATYVMEDVDKILTKIKEILGEE